MKALYVVTLNPGLTASERPWVFSDLGEAKAFIERMVSMSFEGELFLDWLVRNHGHGGPLVHTCRFAHVPLDQFSPQKIRIVPTAGSIMECELDGGRV